MATKTERRAVPYERIHRTIENGKDAAQIARAIGRYDEKKADPTKRVRALLWMMRHNGYRNRKGETVKLKVRRAKNDIGKAKVAVAREGETK
jgi:hypothetical protein